MHNLDPVRMRRLFEHVEYLRHQLSLRVAEMEQAPVVSLADVAMLEELEDELRVRADETEDLLNERPIGFMPALPAAAQ